ncbi:neutral/alkaline non-lysosomal ceramidase N-terminal domain-containing protein [Halosolutus gelatinilyticus]|uniref:neutral/alkaline non-lysosomal ceramidase N-terminal domain-containing protein n=1 Tax=Halosolutus gelatinilyticus TaxID=2931975 RepID=UPI001FF3D7BD|nr:neutral/alkaline non-lysosomal ceramidase N-terminal domain-containing protein [Halosolutus gelatinilyticus]
MSGYGNRTGLSTGVHDPLKATALVLDDGAVAVGIVSVDLLNVSRELTRSVRRSLEERGVRLDQLVLAATHTHAGPHVPARALDVSPVLSADTDVSDTVDRIERRLVDALASAAERVEPAGLRIGHARETDAPRNRRAAGGIGGNVRMPAGPVDPEVTALLIETASGERTVVYNFACHPVCTTGDETLLSADWPGYARRRIEREHADATVLFLNGAAGEINPSGMDPERSGDAVYEYMERIGTTVGEAVLRAIDDAESSDDAIRRAPIWVDEARVGLPVKSTPPVEEIRKHVASLDEQLEQLERAGDEVGREKVFRDRQYARTLLAIAEWDATSLPTHIPYVEVGDLGVLGIPGEALVRHGLDLKAEARVSTLIPAGYANDYVGYVPTLADLESIGYEVRTAKIAPEAIVEFRRATRRLVGADDAL